MIKPAIDVRTIWKNMLTTFAESDISAGNAALFSLSLEA